MDWFVNKVSGLRVFEDENQKMNLNLTQVDGEIMIVPNFTLYADCSHGFRPSFINALKPDQATLLFDQIVDKFRATLGERVKTGVFGADMQITQLNDGPITIVIDSDQI
jgi:D-tyrosyl-tRNA(Tyr) deacylase